MEAQANTTREQSNKKSMEVGDPRMAEMEEKEKKTSARFSAKVKAYTFKLVGQDRNQRLGLKLLAKFLGDKLF